ncbi:MAG: 1-acyl-sn-glycerol-3-phosphate acyltransferase [Chlamydiae bacterium]|nr:1-acyl-sn-glycerol-3-phosphate acyltransferase [Chlamydiota bacterium]
MAKILRRIPVAHAQCYWWASSLIRLNPYWKLRVRGLENIDRNQTYVIVANHQSLADIIVLYKTKMQFKWVAKDVLFKLPLVGWCLKIAKHIQLSRGNYSSIKKSYHEAEEWLRNGISVLFFPEGTRSTTEQMNKFQNGAFKLALQEKKPILPIAINGTRDAIPKGDWLFKTKVLGTLHVLKPIDTCCFEVHEFNRLKNIVRLELEKEETLNERSTILTH